MITRRTSPQWVPFGRPSGFTLIEVFVVILVLGVLVALLLPATRRGREPARRTQCKNNLKQIGLALHNYHDTYGVFPPAYTVDADGKPLHSWRTLILPYLDNAALYRTIDLSKPWDDPANAEARKITPWVYHCPSSAAPPEETTYLAIVTSDSCLQPGKSRSIPEIKDGTSTTIIVFEVAAKDAVHWMSPQDADEQLVLSYGPKTSHEHNDGENVAFVDGSVRFLSQEIAPGTLKALISTTGGETVGDF